MAKITELPRIDAPSGHELIPVVATDGTTAAASIGALAAAAVQPSLDRTLAARDEAVEAAGALGDVVTVLSQQAEQLSANTRAITQFLAFS